MASLAEITQELHTILRQYHDVRESQHIARMIIEETTGLSRTDLITQPLHILTEDQCQTMRGQALRAAGAEPIQYIFNRAWFYNAYFYVNPDVLIPRPETEELVEWVIEVLSSHPQPHILDIGTGSGCIPIALSLALKRARIAAWDISEKAIAIAKGNAESHKVAIDWRHQDVFSEDYPQDSYDCIISNPPYIPEQEQSEIAAHVRDHEPHLALFVPTDAPLLFYERIAALGQKILKPNGFLFFETHYKYADAVGKMLREMGYGEVVERKDMSGLPRMVQAIKK